MSTAIILVGLLLLSYFGHNMTMVYTMVILLVLHYLLPAKVMTYVASHGVNWGIILLSVAMLAPLATGAIGFPDIVSTFKSPEGIVAIVVGILVAIVGKSGVAFLSSDPQVVVALTVGTIIGVFFFKGLPMGPLIAGGTTYFCLKFMHFLLDILK
ncbi:MAG: DUF441 domain-containing protein [Acidaminococcaceae bacterium]|jgi:uncharacterized membrane protein (DUF441 family)|nr:DUF441 domain-containing protein [Acidaminococcaceae bacterium]MCI2109743.1 DUF441 domain-containing protein [Acidaminococcaceae bacterium]